MENQKITISKMPYCQLLILLFCMATIHGYSQKLPLKTFQDPSGKISKAMISHGSDFFATGNELGILTVWNYNSGKELFKTRHHKSKINFIFFHPTSNEVISADENEVIFSNLTDGSVFSKISIFQKIEWIEVSPVDDKFFILASIKGMENSQEIYQVDLKSRKYDKFYSEAKISKFKIAPDGNRMFMTRGNDMDFVNIDLQIVDKEFNDHLSKIRTIDVNPNDPEWMVTSDKNLVRYWQTATGRNVPLKWSVDYAFLIYDSQILTGNQDTVMVRDYKSMYKKDILKIAIGDIKDVFVNDQRNLAFVHTFSNQVEVYETGVDAVPMVAQEASSVKEVTTSSATAGTTKANVAVDADDQFIYNKFQTEIDAELALKSSLFIPRGEFEKSSDYDIRLAEAKNYKESIFTYYKDKHFRSQELEKSMALAKQRYLDSLAKRDDDRMKSLYREKIRDSYKEYYASIESLGTYNPDLEHFPVTIEGITENVKVPIDKAREFKEDFKDVKVIISSQLLDDAATLDKFNIKIYDKKTRAIYDFGKQKDPLFVKLNPSLSLLAQTMAASAPVVVAQATSTNLSRGEESPSENKEDNLEVQMISYLNQKKYYALLIGVEDYQDPGINKLDNPVNDALRLKGVLQNEYTFNEENIILLKNPTRTEIIESFDVLSQKIQKDDNLLIFYAGHGIWDENLKQGYWLPKDAKKDSKAAWLSNGTIRDYVGGIKTKHTLLIADACFSGGIFKTRDIFTGSNAILELYKLPSRKAMTSGNMKTVPDKSVFMEYLIKRLQDNQNNIISAEQLFSSLRTAVINNSSGQVPQYGDIREAGDEGGDFVLLKRK